MSIQVKNEIEVVIPAELDDLPGTEVQLESVKYIIHGIFHGKTQNDFSKKVIEFIRKKCEKYHNPSKGEDYICEEGFADLFGLEKANEMDDIVYGLGKNIFRSISRVYLITPICLGTYLKSKAKTLVSELFIKDKYKKSRITTNELAYKQRLYSTKALKDIRYLPIARDLYKLNPKSLQYQTTNFTMYNLQGEIFDYLIKPERSKYMADFIKEFTKKNNLRTLHAIVGLYHEPEIEYFLKLTPSF